MHAQLRLNSISAESFFSLMEVKKGSASRVGMACCMTIFMKMSVHLLCKNGLLTLLFISVNNLLFWWKVQYSKYYYYKNESIISVIIINEN